MNPETRAITPTEYQGVQLVSFGFAGQGSAIMRGAMVSGLIQQMLTTSEWGEWSAVLALGDGVWAGPQSAWYECVFVLPSGGG